MAYRQRLSGWLALALATLAVVAPVSAFSSGAELPASRLNGDWRFTPPVLIENIAPALPPGASDLGAASAGARLDRMLLLLDASTAQREALNAEIANQQNPKSGEFHHWLTPSGFAEAYSNSVSDVAAVVSWLESKGFAVAPLPAGRGWIEFSGTVTQLEQAFQTHVRSLSTRNGARLALAGSISVPAALRPLIHGLASLDAVVAEPAVTTLNPVAKAAADLRATTSLAGSEAVTPELAARSLHMDAVHASGGTGAGETIAIAARSNIQAQDVAAFRTSFGLPESPVKVILNGENPGRTQR